MSLRSRQISGIPLDKGSALLLTLLCACVCIPAMWFFVWSKLFTFIPKEIHTTLVGASILFYLSECFERVPLNKERSLLFFGSYTGASFPAGLCLVPKLPFPIISFVITVVFGPDIAKYFGWVLEGDADIVSMTIPCEGDGLTSDGVRVAFTFSAVLEVENTATFLSQIKDNPEGRRDFLLAVAADVTKQVKVLIRKTGVRDFIQGNFESKLEEGITVLSRSIEEYGLSVRTLVGIDVNIMSKEIEHAFDTVLGSSFLENSAQATVKNFQAFYQELKKNNPNIEETTALILFQSSRGKPLDGFNLFSMTGRNK